MSNSFVQLFETPVFWAPLCAWVTAQFTKMLVSCWRTHRLDFSYLVSLGGMPSAHSASVSALATVVGLREGFGSSLFVVALGFAMVVMFDAATVRRAAGMQARLLNEIIDEMFKEHRFSERKLGELLGHTRVEVLMGLLVGILMALLVESIAVFMT